MKNATDLLKEFCRTYYTDQDAAAALRLLTDDVRWFGTSDRDDVAGIREARAYIETEIAQMQSPYTLRFRDESFVPTGAGGGVAALRMTIVTDSMELTCRISACSRVENGEAKLCSLHVSVADASVQQHAYFPETAAKAKENAIRDSLLDDIFSGGMMMCYDTPDLPVYYVNKSLWQMLGFGDSAAYLASIDGHSLGGAHPDERADIERQARRQMDEGGSYSVVYRMRRADDSYIWVRDSGKRFVTDSGQAAISSIIYDISESKRAEAQLNDLVKNVSCGLILCHIDASRRLTLTYLNDAYYTICEIKPRPAAVPHVDALLVRTHADDRQRLRDGFAQLTATLSDQSLTYRFITDKGKVKHALMHARVVRHEDGTATVYATLLDVTNEHTAEENLRASQQALQFAAEHAGLHCWRYDAACDRAFFDARTQAEFSLPYTVDNFLETWHAPGRLLPSYTDISRDAYHRIADGQKQAVFEAQLYGKDGAVHWWRFRLANLFDQDGCIITTVCTAMVIDREKELLSKYELEKRKPSLREENLIAHALINLTTGETITYAYRDGSPVPFGDRTAFMWGADTVDALIPDPDERARFRALNDMEAMRSRFEAGETEHQFDYQRHLPDGTCIWVRNILHLLRDPAGSDVLAFEYYYDVEEETLQAQTYHSLANDNYEFVARINLKTGRFRVMPKAGLLYGMPPAAGNDVDETVRALADANVVPEDREATFRNTCIAGITENLATRDRFHFTYRVMDEDGSVSYKKLTEYYLDRQRGIVILAREDVTEVVRDEMRKNEILAAALAAANQANHAKSQFLSRMSHELRTPMNAIIGLSALSAADVNDPAAMSDTIGKIGLSARYLLSLINDILEMSRIESGRMTLSEAPFSFEALILSVNNIICGQASDRGVDYEAIVSGFPDVSYVGDMVKLQQVLINVLGNAVKFTPPGGRVTLTVEQARRTRSRATMRFIVSDTGAGISEEFLPHLFEAFTQEEIGYSTAAAGIGLGLAISKSMTELMGGRIYAKSILGMGSVFTIEVPLGLTPQAQQQLRFASSLHLQKLSALIVDDDVIVCRTTEQTLTNMGIRAEWVESGPLAIERVRRARAEGKDFDTIFIDWRMPEMDGIETARQIRRIVGPEVTIIIITAYDWKSIEAEARAAGVDLFMDKPLMQASLLRTFGQLLSGGMKQDAPPDEAQYDFTGRRFLLAEDHPLNVEVAKRLLARVGAEVTVTGNGLEALEAFASAPDHHFSAILMDIRMPVMDGLTATRNIRGMKKPDSKRIPIVAMTANAFDEDVERSFSHGMNAHLIKPIEPMALYAMLQRLLDERETPPDAKPAIDMEEYK